MLSSAKRPQVRAALLAICLLLCGFALREAYPAHLAAQPTVSHLPPTFSAPSGYYDHDLRVTLRSPQPGAQLFFTLDGSTPALTAATPYTQPLHLHAQPASVVVLRAQALLPDGQWSPIASATYFMDLPASLPFLSLIVEPDDLWSPDHGIYANPTQKGTLWERPVTVTYVAQDRESGFELAAGLRVHGGGSREFDKKSFRLYFREDYGSRRLDYPLFEGNEVQSFDRLIVHNGGQDHAVTPSPPFPPRLNWTLMRNALADTIAREINGCAVHDQPVVLFLNGELWGIYYLREHIDETFLDDHYDVEDTDFIEAAGHMHEQEVAMGDEENWDNLTAYLESHNLADPAAYAYVQSQVNIDNFIDYNLLQLYGANDDWPERNVHQFRPRVQGGQWHWLFWDSDHSFGLQPHSSAEMDMVERALTYDHPVTEGRDLLLLRSLLNNPDFRTQFLTRAADLLNTVLRPDAVIAHIDTLAAEIAPDITYETLRWASAGNWPANIESLRDFARRRPAIFRQHLIASFDLDGTADLAIVPPTSGSGTVAVNDSLIDALPWQGTYFQGLPVQLTAAPAPGYRFTGWDSPDLPASPTITLTLATSMTLAPRFELLTADVPQPGDLIFTTIHHDDGDTWFELQVQRSGGVDLRGWRITDNDTKTATDEGSLIFADDPALASVHQGTRIRIIASGDDGQAANYSHLGARQLILTLDDSYLQTHQDPGFILGEHDNLVLLAPGPTDAFADDQGIAFLSENSAVTPASFGVLSDGVRASTQP